MIEMSDEETRERVRRKRERIERDKMNNSRKLHTKKLKDYPKSEPSSALIDGFYKGKFNDEE